MGLKKSCISKILLSVYSLLYKVYGPQHWWPADDDFEVCVGAILTQNTSWLNVEKAIHNLKSKRLLTPSSLYSLGTGKIANLIRCCGYYNIKARRLKNFIDYLFLRHQGKIDSMRSQTLTLLRNELLKINGIGPESADSIILYAVKKPIFVVDAYSKRIMSCLGLADSSTDYDDIQSLFMSNLPRSVKLFNEYHALLVKHAKDICRTVPRCGGCVLHPLKKT